MGFPFKGTKRASLDGTVGMKLASKPAFGEKDHRFKATGHIELDVRFASSSCVR
jgi:hypothetical protein